MTIWQLSLLMTCTLADVAAMRPISYTCFGNGYTHMDRHTTCISTGSSPCSQVSLTNRVYTTLNPRQLPELQTPNPYHNCCCQGEDESVNLASVYIVHLVC